MREVVAIAARTVILLLMMLASSFAFYTLVVDWTAPTGIVTLKDHVTSSTTYAWGCGSAQCTLPGFPTTNVDGSVNVDFTAVKDAFETEVGFTVSGLLSCYITDCAKLDSSTCPSSPTSCPYSQCEVYAPDAPQFNFGGGNLVTWATIAGNGGIYTTHKLFKTWDGTFPGAPSWTTTLNPGSGPGPEQGTSTIKVKCGDNAGNLMAVAIQDDIYEDDVDPSQSITVTGGNTNALSVVLPTSEVDYGLGQTGVVAAGAKVEYMMADATGGSCGTYGSWTDYAPCANSIADCTFTFPTDCACYKYRYAVKDASGRPCSQVGCAFTAGNYDGPIANFLHDRTAPTVSVTGAPANYVNSDVTLNVGCSDGCFTSCNSGSYKMYNKGSSGACSGVSGDYTLTPAVTATAYGWYCSTAIDGAGNRGFTATATEVKIDKTAPVTTDNAPADWVTTDVVATLTPTDAASGMTGGAAFTKYCVDAANTCTPTTSGTTVSITDCAVDTFCTKYIRYQSMDYAGNLEIVKSKTVRIDKTKPGTTDNAVTTWTATSPYTVTLAPTDTGSGMSGGQATTKYCIDTANTCDPASGSTGTAASVTCGSGSVCQQYVRYFSKDYAGNQEITKSSVVIRIDRLAPGTTDNAVTAWTTVTPTTVTLTPTDPNSGMVGGQAGTWYCIDTANSCTPTTSGWSVSVSCGVGLTCQQYVRYYSKDFVGNQETTKSSVVIRNDQTPPVTTDSASSTWTSTSPVTVTLTPTDTGSGMSGGQATTKYCIDTTGTCDPTTGTVGTSASVTCGANQVCPAQYVRYMSKDYLGNAEPTKTSLVTRIDRLTPGTTDNIADSTWRNTDRAFTLTPTDGAGASLTTKFCVDVSGTCNPVSTGTVGTSGVLTCTAGTVCSAQYLRYYTYDEAGNAESVKTSLVTKIDKQAPGTSDNYAASVWTGTSPVTVTITPTDYGASGIASTLYCIDTPGSCTPTTPGTTASVTCGSGSTCKQYVRYASTDLAGNVETTKTSLQTKIDREPPTTPSWTSSMTTSAGCPTLQWSTVNDPNSGAGLVGGSSQALLTITRATDWVVNPALDSPANNGCQVSLAATTNTYTLGTAPCAAHLCTAAAKYGGGSQCLCQGGWVTRLQIYDAVANMVEI